MAGRRIRVNDETRCWGRATRQLIPGHGAVSLTALIRLYSPWFTIRNTTYRCYRVSVGFIAAKYIIFNG